MGGNWLLVRHISSLSTGWHPVSDAASGTAPPYGLNSDNFSSTPTSNISFSFSYGASEPIVSSILTNNIMFDTGDHIHYVVINKLSLNNYGNGVGSPQLQILYSDLSSTPYYVYWYAAHTREFTHHFNIVVIIKPF